MNRLLMILVAGGLSAFAASQADSAILLSDGTLDPGETNLQLWLKADAGLFEGSGGTDPVEYSGDLVTRWANQATSTVADAVQNLDASPQAQQTTFFGNPAKVVRFNGVTTGLDVADHDDLDPGSGGLTVFVVGKQITASHADFWYAKGAASTGSAGYATYADSTTLYARARGSNYAQSTHAADFTNPIILSQTLTGSTSYTNQGRLNGSTAGWTNQSYGGPIATSEIFKIGGVSSGSDTRAFDGDIAELVIFNRELSDPDRRRVQDYLYEKYFATTPPGTDRPLVNYLRLHTTLDSADINNPTVVDTAGLQPENGTIVGTLGNPAGKIGEALDFNGSSSNYVSFGDVLDPGTDSYTVSLWFNPDDVISAQMLANKGNSSSSQVGWNIWMTGDDIVVRGAQVGGAQFSQTNANSITAGQWHHVVMVLDRDADTVSGYLNGSDLGWSGTGGLIAGSSIETSDAMLLGRRVASTYPFGGLIDDFAIWDRALSPDEIAWVYQKGLLGYDAATIPEPSTLVLLALGVLGLLARRGRSKSAIVT